MTTLEEIHAQLEEYQRYKIDEPDYSDNIYDALRSLEDAIAHEKSFDHEIHKSEMRVYDYEEIH